MYACIYAYVSTRSGQKPSGTLSQHLSYQQKTICKQGTTRNELELSESMCL